MRINRKRAFVAASFLSATIFALNSPAIFAHHGHDHGPSPTPAPAPPPPPPAPVMSLPAMQAPAPINPAVTLFTNIINNAANSARLPVTMPPNGVMLPTDATGIGGGLGRAQGLGNNVVAPGQGEGLSFKEAMKMVERDKRYDFGREWTTFTAEELVADNDGIVDNEPIRPVIEQLHMGKVVHTARTVPAKGKEPAFMPTSNAHIHKVGPDELELADGAVLLRAGNRPFYVTTNVGGQKIRTRIHGNVLSLVSTMDNRLTIANLTDLCCGACTAYVPGAKPGQFHSVYVSIGEIAEVRPAEEKESKTLPIATKMLSSHKLADGMQMQVFPYHFFSLFKRYNIAQALPKEDLAKVLKTQAAKVQASGHW
ncbi:MAG: hypothetical protein K2Y22_01530 [Candidatus Obscuribacterales bacterium]|nr:hypothetical protein [Candidatus Obscuribacterales bacterium]